MNSKSNRVAAIQMASGPNVGANLLEAGADAVVAEIEAAWQRVRASLQRVPLPAAVASNAAAGARRDPSVVALALTTGDPRREGDGIGGGEIAA